MNLESLVQFYRETIKEKADLASKGEISPNNESYLFDIEREKYISDLNDLYKFTQDDLNDLVRLRQKLLLGELYDRLKRIDKADREEISFIVRNPLLDGAFLWLEGKGGLEQVTREEFTEEFEPRDFENINMRIPTYLRPIVLLELLNQFPEKIHKLEESSTYFPHRLFKEKKLTIEDIDAGISEVLPTLFSEELVSRLGKIERYIKPKKAPGGSPYVEIRMGKYALPASGALTWTKVREAEKKLDELYNQVDMKREIYYTLNECFRLIGQTHSHKRGKSAAKHSKTFRISPTDYSVARVAMLNYAKNQFLYIWKATEGKQLGQPTPLTKAHGLRARIKDDQLVISHETTEEYLRLDSHYRHTTDRLPFIVYLLNRFYNNAIKLNKERQKVAK